MDEFRIGCCLFQQLKSPPANEDGISLVGELPPERTTDAGAPAGEKDCTLRELHG